MNKAEVEEDVKEVGWFGRFRERMDNLNRRVKPKCRKAVKSQVENININICLRDRKGIFKYP